MKRKFLEDLGLEKEAIDKIMAENDNDVNAAKAEYDSMKQERDTMAAQVAERDKQLETLKNSTGDMEALKQQIITLQADNQAAKEKYDADMKELKLSTAIRLALGESAQDSDLVAGLFDKSKLILSDDGKVTGLEEQLKSLKRKKLFCSRKRSRRRSRSKAGSLRRVPGHRQQIRNHQK